MATELSEVQIEEAYQQLQREIAPVLEGAEREVLIGDGGYVILAAWDRLAKELGVHWAVPDDVAKISSFVVDDIIEGSVLMYPTSRPDIVVFKEVEDPNPVTGSWRQSRIYLTKLS